MAKREHALPSCGERTETALRCRREVEADLRTFCLQAYPSYQVVFGVREPGDPAIAIVERLIHEFPALDLTLVAGQRRRGRNRKVASLAVLLGQADAIEFVARNWFDFTIQDVAQGRPLRTVAGLSYRVDGRVHHTPDRPLLEDIDALPFVADVYRRDLTIELYAIGYLLHPYVSLYTGRGCRSKRTFCLWPQTVGGPRYRTRSVEHVVREVALAVRYFLQVKEYFFDDDTFTDDVPRAEAIAHFAREIDPDTIQVSIAAPYPDAAQRSNEPDDALHALDYMTYAYLQLARDGDARKTLEEARTLTGLNPARATAYYALAAMPARYVIERGAWRDAATLAPNPSNFPFTEAMTHFARALGAARSGDPAAAQKDIDEIAALRDRPEGGEERLLGERGRGDVARIRRLGRARADTG